MNPDRVGSSCRRGGPRSRRGFTLLEVSFAATLGTLVAFGATTLLLSVLKTDDALQKRFGDISDVERTRLVIERAMTTLVMSDVAEPRPPRENRAQPVEGQTPEPPADADRDRQREEALRRIPPRVTLAPELETVSGSWNTRARPDAGPLQRMTVVLSKSPVPVAPGTGADPGFDFEAARKARDADDDSRLNAASDGGFAAIRGAFVLRPQPPTEANEPPRDWLELWWVPLPPVLPPDSTERARMSRAAGRPVRLCSGILDFRWSVYDDRTFRDTAEVRWQRELPAYVRTQMTLANGMSFEWLFEVDWVTGKEATEPEPGRDGTGGPETGGTPGGGPRAVMPGRGAPR